MFAADLYIIGNKCKCSHFGWKAGDMYNKLVFIG